MYVNKLAIRVVYSGKATAGNAIDKLVESAKGVGFSFTVTKITCVYLC